MTWGASPVAAAAENLGVGGGTSSPLNTVGADTIFCSVGHAAGSTLTISDSNTNSWTLVDTADDGSGHLCDLFLATNAVVSSAHTFTVLDTTGNVGVAIAAFSGGDPTSPTDQFAHSAANFTSNLSVGPITPSQNDDVLIVAVANVGGGGIVSAISDGFTLAASVAESSTNFGAALAYLVQTTAASSGPTVTTSVSSLSISLVEASFITGSGGGGSPGYTLSGTGIQSLVPDTHRIIVEITTQPTRMGEGRAYPANVFDVGLLRPMDSGGNSGRTTPIDATLMFLDLPDATTAIGYSLFEGAIVQMVEA